MAFLRRLTSADEERALAGRAPQSSELAEVAMFARTLRATLLVQPDPGASAVLIGRLAATARASASTVASTPTVKRVAPPRPRLALVARIAVAAALLPLFMAGLAVAGVSLPGPAQSAFDRVGVELPNQSDEDQSDDRGTGAGAGQDGADQPASAPSAAGEAEGMGTDTAREDRGDGKLKSNPAREVGGGNGAQGQARAVGKQGEAPGHSNPNRGGQGNGKAIGKTDGTPPGQAKRPKPPKPKHVAPKPKPQKPNSGGSKQKSK